MALESAIAPKNCFRLLTEVNVRWYTPRKTESTRVSPWWILCLQVFWLTRLTPQLGESHALGKKICVRRSGWCKNLRHEMPIFQRQEFTIVSRMILTILLISNFFCSWFPVNCAVLWVFGSFCGDGKRLCSLTLQTLNLKTRETGNTPPWGGQLVGVYRSFNLVYSKKIHIWPFLIDRTNGIRQDNLSQISLQNIWLSPFLAQATDDWVPTASGAWVPFRIMAQVSGLIMWVKSDVCRTKHVNCHAVISPCKMAAGQLSPSLSLCPPAVDTCLWFVGFWCESDRTVAVSFSEHDKQRFRMLFESDNDAFSCGEGVQICLGCSESDTLRQWESKWWEGKGRERPHGHKSPFFLLNLTIFCWRVFGRRLHWEKGPGLNILPFWDLYFKAIFRAIKGI